MSLVLHGTDGVTFNDSSLQGAAASPFVLKNRIINGAMVIDQRNAGASTTPTGAGSGIYTLDRWCYQAAQTGKVTVQQNAGAVTPPTGFKNYAGITSASSYSVLTSDYFHLYQAIEGFNVSDLNWGTANAQTITISFWVRSSLTGTFGGSLRNAAVTRSYPFTYTISVANTFEGQIARLKVGFDEAKESVGAALLPTLQRLLDYFINTVIPKFIEFKERHARNAK